VSGAWSLRGTLEYLQVLRMVSRNFGDVMDRWWGGKVVQKLPNTLQTHLLFIWLLVTLPEGMLSLLSAEATPGILLLVLNSGRCSLGVLADLDSLSIDV
jgi:hypothetical protein